jgi:MFS family permease
MLTGAILLLLAVASALHGIMILNFMVSMFFLGMGWNFLFVGGSTLLTEVHTPSERGKTQAAHDFMVFATTALGSFLSGQLLFNFGRERVNLMALPLIITATLLVIWFGFIQRAEDTAAPTV